MTGCLANIIVTNNNFRYNLAAPFKVSEGDDLRDNCLQYDVNYTSILTQGIRSPDISWPTKPCHYWEYNLASIGGYHSIVTEVCDIS